MSHDAIRARRFATAMSHDAIRAMLQRCHGGEAGAMIPQAVPKEKYENIIKGTYSQLILKIRRRGRAAVRRSAALGVS